jgi:2,5-diketo-D-gluconate reductase A
VRGIGLPKFVIVKPNFEQALEDLHSKGVLRAIGVSNFLVDDLKNLAKTQTIPPAINQMLLYVGYHEDDDVIAYCAQNNIVYEAYSPLDEGGVLNISVVVSIAEEHNVSPAQVALRWSRRKAHPNYIVSFFLHP